MSGIAKCLACQSLNGGQDILDTMFHLTQNSALQLFGLFSVADIMGAFGRTDDASIAIPDRRYRQLNIQSRTILVQPHCFMRCDSETARDQAAPTTAPTVCAVHSYRAQ